MFRIESYMSQFLGVLSALGVFGLLMRGALARIKTLEAGRGEQARDIADLKDRRIVALERRVEEHTGADRTQEFSTKLETVIAQNNEILLEQKKLNRESAEQATTLARNEKSLNNLWDKFDKCRETRGRTK